MCIRSACARCCAVCTGRSSRSGTTPITRSVTRAFVTHKCRPHKTVRHGSKLCVSRLCCRRCSARALRVGEFRVWRQNVIRFRDTMLCRRRPHAALCVSQHTREHITHVAMSLHISNRFVRPNLHIISNRFTSIRCGRTQSTAPKRLALPTGNPRTAMDIVTPADTHIGMLCANTYVGWRVESCWYSIRPRRVVNSFRVGRGQLPSMCRNTAPTSAHTICEIRSGSVRTGRD